MKFCVGTWQKMSQKGKNQLTDTAQNVFHLLEQFSKLEKNQIQDLISPNCRQFQLYFYKNLFDLVEKSKIFSHAL